MHFIHGRYTESMNGYVIFKRVMIVITEKGEYEKPSIIYVIVLHSCCSSFLWCGLFSFLNDFCVSITEIIFDSFQLALVLL